MVLTNGKLVSTGRFGAARLCIGYSCVLVLLGGLLSACSGPIVRLHGRGTVPILLNNPTQKVELIKHVTVGKMSSFDNTATYDVSELLAKQVQQSDAEAVINLAVTVKKSFGTFFLNLFTLGIANAKVLSVSADLVKLEGGLSGLLDGGYEVVSTVDTLDQLALSRAAAGQTSLVRLGEGFALVRSK